MPSPAGAPTTDAEVAALILRPKPIADVNWRSRLVPRAVASDPANRRGTFQLSDWVGDEWLVYTRESFHDLNNWSAGLIFDPDGINLRVVRCNGPHAGVHRNRLDPADPPIVVTPHVHYLREAYLNHRRTREDGYAVPTAAYTDLGGALRHLVAVSNFVPEGRLFL